MNMKKIASVALAAALSASLLAGCGGGSEGGSDSVTLKIGDNWGATHPMAAALDTVFKPQIEEQTGGAVKVEVYHDGLLGDRGRSVAGRPRRLCGLHRCGHPPEPGVPHDADLRLALPVPRPGARQERVDRRGGR